MPTAPVFSWRMSLILIFSSRKSDHIFFLAFLFPESLELGTGSLGQALALGRI
jgi:hypothetical protein